MSDNAITVRDLHKSYGKNEAVKGISFDVKKGEFFAFLGENGAGKTTTINILCTILEKTSGYVSIFGNELGKNDDKIRSEFGIVFQHSVLDRKLTVEENLLSRGAFYNLNKKATLQRLEPFMEPLSLSEVWKRKYKTLSGGQQRRVDIARALIHQPKILFLDEPTTGLDPKSRKMVWEEIDKLRCNDKLTIFLTTHYMEETKDADSVVILDHGKILDSGTPTQLKERHARSRLVWYTQKTLENDTFLSGCEHAYDANHYNIFINGSITEFLYENRNRIVDYEILKGSMDDVFLNLTGKEL